MTSLISGWPFTSTLGCEPNPHQDRGVLQHARDVLSVSKAIAVLIVAAVMNEERIGRVLAEAGPRVRRRHGAGFAAVTRQAGSSVAAERLAVEEPLPLEEVVDGLTGKLPRLAARVARLSLRSADATP